MRYVLLVCGDEQAMMAASPEEIAAMTREYDAFGQEMAGRGVLEGGTRLRPATDATTVRVRDGEVIATDGPFAETKEQIAGHYVVDCKDLDEALGWRPRSPGPATARSR